MTDIIESFFKAFFSFSDMKAVYVLGKTSPEMMAEPIDSEGWYRWKPINGRINIMEYHAVEDKFSMKFPESFIEWHKAYFFMDGDCSILRLPYSEPNRPLEQLIDELDNDFAKHLIKQKLYPFAQGGNDEGALVFDAREKRSHHDYPIRVCYYEFLYDHEAISEIIFSSFSKLLECMTYFLNEIKTQKDYEIIPHFLSIDPEGAGKSGIDYWLGLVAYYKDNATYFNGQHDL
ncbi:hypothetical protein [Pedobacter sp.]|uniref:hypothetical protein n=1 Tax=Pedobacter sp. TaxID=1411316 RepID=UPI00396C42AB